MDEHFKKKCEECGLIYWRRHKCQKQKKHAFKFNEDVKCSICEECGYVWGEKPYRKCGTKIKCLHLFHGRNSETKETYCKECGHVLTDEEIRLDNERRR